MGPSRQEAHRARVDELLDAMDQAEADLIDLGAPRSVTITRAVKALQAFTPSRPPETFATPRKPWHRTKTA